jgi:transglutaminase-like putative cysteine protease
MQIARPMVELLMFVLVMRLLGLRREREKWHVAVLLFFLFVAAMATSIHPLILVYLLVLFVLWLILLVRFLQLHLEAAYPLVVPGSQLRPQRLVTAFAVITILVAVPFFTLLPRVRTPFIMGSGSSRQPGYSTGFRDEVNLDVVGNIRTNPAVALRMKPDNANVTPPALLRGTTYDQFQDNSWRRTRSRQEMLRWETANLYRLAPDETVDTKIRVYLEPIDTRSLLIPLETVSIELSDRLFDDVAGGVLMLQQRTTLLQYRVGIASRPIHRADLPRLDDPTEPTLDRGGITPRIEELAKKLGAGLAPAQAAQQFQQYLAHNMTYSLDFLGRNADNPIEDFLFRYQSGHCEYFATAMILMLRSVGIPARLATGFLGNEFNPLEDYYIVRQSNAHAWVEAYLPGSGWTTIDPTPPAGRPSAEAAPTLGLVLRQAWDYLEFRWDRYVMAYGFFDQVNVLLRFRDFVKSMAAPGDRSLLRFERRPGAKWQELDRGFGFDLDYAPFILLLTGPLLAILAVMLWRMRSKLPVATRAYSAMRAAVTRRDPAIGAATGPLALAHWLECNAPAASAAGGGVIELYLLESWKGAPLDRRQASAVRRDLRLVRRVLRSGRPGAAQP